MLQMTRERERETIQIRTQEDIYGKLLSMYVSLTYYLPTTLLFQSDLQYIIDPGITIHIMALSNVCRVLVDGR